MPLSGDPLANWLDLEYNSGSTFSSVRAAKVRAYLAFVWSPSILVPAWAKPYWSPAANKTRLSYLESSSIRVQNLIYRVTTTENILRYSSKLRHPSIPGVISISPISLQTCLTYTSSWSETLREAFISSCFAFYICSRAARFAFLTVLHSSSLSRSYFLIACCKSPNLT